MSKRTNMLFAIVLAGLAFSMLASARDVGSIGVVLGPVVVNPDDAATEGNESGDTCTTESVMCWDL